MRKFYVFSLVALAEAATIHSGALAQFRAGGRAIVPDSGFEAPSDVGVNAHTTFDIFIPSEPFGTPDAAPARRVAQSAAVGLPPYLGYTYETPASLGCVYGLSAAVAGCNPNSVTAAPDAGTSGKAIAIVDAYHYPSAERDLAAFSAQFGLPAPTASSFQVVFASGSQPRVNSSWNIEEALDIEWAHAISPNAVIYLVEARSSSFADLLTAVSKANSLLASSGGTVSMSWGGSEFSSETSYDSYFGATNVVYFAASGDSPGVLWPSTSPRVVSAGGASTDRNSSGVFLGQTTWQSGGGGPSEYEPPAPGQTSSITGFTTRATPDVAADANPATGVWVYENGNWYIVGGTSVATPIWAGIDSAVDDRIGTSAFLTEIYGDLGNAADFTAITTGTCGPGNAYSAGAGWNPCTGIGAPNTLAGK